MPAKSSHVLPDEERSIRVWKIVQLRLNVVVIGAEAIAFRAITMIPLISL